RRRLRPYLPGRAGARWRAGASATARRWSPEQAGSADSIAVLHAAAEDAVLEEGQQQNDHRKNIGDGSGVAELPLTLEALLVEVHYEGHGGHSRPAGGGHHELRDEDLEAADHGDDEEEKGDGAQERESDGAELLP